MKIIILIQCTNLGGMEHNMLLLIQELRKLGIAVEVVSIHPLGQLSDKLIAMGIPSEGCEYKGPWGMFSLFKLRRQLAAKTADGLIMIGHNMMGELAVGNLCKKHRVLSIHYHHRGVKHPLVWRLIYGIACVNFRAIVFVSSYIMDEAIAIVPFLRKFSLMVSTPVEVHEPFAEFEKSGARKSLGIPDDVFLVGNAGWLIPRKRWDLFLEVAARVAAKAPGARYVIAGDGPLRAELEAKAVELGIADKIIWLGWQKDLLPFYKSIDVLLFNSDWDAQARTPLEGMSYGVPVVASILSGGTREVITDRSIGFLLGEHDTDRLAGEIIRLAEDPSQRLKIGEAGRARIAEYGSPRNHALKVLMAMGLHAPEAQSQSQGTAGPVPLER